MLRASLVVRLAVALCCLPTGAISAQEHDAQLQERFVQGVNQTWKNLQHIEFRARFVCTSTDSTSDKADVTEYQIGIRGPTGLQTGVRKGITFVQARNDAYAFRLHRSPQGAGGSLEFVERVGMDPSVDARITAMEGEPRAVALAAYYLWREPLARVIERESFKIERVYAVPFENHEVVRVEFNYDMNDPSRRVHLSYTDGYVVSDPSRQWVVKEYGATFLNLNDKATGTTKTVLEHDDAIGEMPIATHITRTFARDDMRYTSKNVMNLTITGRSLAEEELYLSHYGLPEPNFRRSWLGTWGWYLIGGIACIAIGTILTRRRNTAR